MLNVEMGEEDFKKWRPVMNYCINAKLINMYLGRNVHVVTVGGALTTTHERIYQQRLKRVHVMYTSQLSCVDFPYVVVPYKEVRGYMKDGSRAPRHNVSIVKELMDLTLEVKENGVTTLKPVFHSVHMVVRGPAEGSLRAFFMREDTRVKRITGNMSMAFIPWMAGYLLNVRGYHKDTVMPLMESFATNKVILAEDSKFDVKTLTVKTEFPDKEEWLEDMEEQFGLDGKKDEGEGKVMLVTDAKGTIGALLRRDMKMDDLDRDGVSKAEGDDATSLGQSTNASVGPGEIARNHESRKLENHQLKLNAQKDQEKWRR